MKPRRLQVAKSVLGFAGLLLCSCTGADPDGGLSDYSDLGSEAELQFGTESGNPGESLSDDTMGIELGTESGNPGVGEGDPSEETGTESGNPTRPPPESPDITVTEGFGDGRDNGVSTNSPDDDAPAVPPSTEQPEPTGANPDAAANGCDPMECATFAEAEANSLASPVNAPAPFDSAVCNTNVCTCSNASITVALDPNAAGECLVSGRAGCLYQTSEATPCDVTQSATCQTACDDVAARLTTDASGAPYAVRASTCTASGCRYVLTAGDQCVLGGDSLSVEPVDCSTPDGDLLGSR